MGVHIYDYNWDFFNEESERRYYFLGFIAADGYISNSEIEIGVNAKDAYLVEQFRDWIVPDKPLYNKAKTDSVLFKISCKFLIEGIKEYFSMASNRKGEEIRFPNVPYNFVKDFIRGVVDGNGCIDATKAYRGTKIYVGPRLRILGNHDFLEGLNEITKLYVSHNTNSIARKGHENVFCVTYNFYTASNLLHWLYDNNNICLARKYNKYLTVTNQVEDIV